MTQIHGFDYFPLSFDRNGTLSDPAQYSALESHAKQNGVTDVLFIAHGFRNNEQEATDLYTKFLETFRTNISRPELAASFATRKFAVAGVLWPSKSFSEGATGDGSVAGAGADPMDDVTTALEALKDEFGSPQKLKAIDDAISLLHGLEGNPEAQDVFVDKVLSLLSGDDADPTEGLDRVLAQPGHELLQKLRAPVILPAEDDGSDDGGVASVDATSDAGGAAGIGGFFGKIGGAAGKLMNMTTWYLMKERSGIVGANGMQQAVRSLHGAAPSARLHLVGHSLGARLMTSCAKALATVPRLEVDTLALLQGAFSHYGFSSNNGFGSAGFFRPVMDEHVVKGPIIATYSKRDTVVGYAYAISSRLAGDNVKAIGDASDQYGGLGRNGAQRTSESKSHTLLAPGGAYQFTSGVVNNVNGDAIIQDHGDIKRAEVTWAFAQAVALAP